MICVYLCVSAVSLIFQSGCALRNGISPPAASRSCTAAGSGGTSRTMPRAGTATRPMPRSSSISSFSADSGHIAFDHRQAVVDAVAEKLPSEGRGDDRPHSHHAQDVHRLLARGVVAEVPAGDDYVTLRQARRETWRELLEGMLRDIGVVPARVVLARAMNIRVDLVAEQMSFATDQYCHIQVKEQEQDLATDKHRYTQMKIKHRDQKIRASILPGFDPIRVHLCSSVFICGFIVIHAAFDAGRHSPPSTVRGSVM